MTIQNAMSELLSAQGFTTMARDVLNETDKSRLAKYAKVVIKNAPREMQATLANKFRLVGLY